MQASIRCPRRTNAIAMSRNCRDSWERWLERGETHLTDEPRQLTNGVASGAGVDPRRFAVLVHSDRKGRHYDLLIEAGEVLATWKSDKPPEEANDAGLPCRRIADHRPIYLEYEGPISRGRGHVERRDAGECLVHVCTSTCWEITFRGERLRGVFRITQSDKDAEAWSFVRV